MKDAFRRAMNQFRFTRNLLSDHEDRKTKREFARDKNDLSWKLGPRAPIACVEAGHAKLGDRLYLFGGYTTMDSVSSAFHVLDLNTDRWIHSGALPPDAAQTHQGITTDGERHIFLISGQDGAHCSPCIPSCFVLDAETLRFDKLPPLPEACYMPIVQFLNGQIHCISGSSAGRSTPGNKHWSLPVENGKPTQAHWNSHPDSPLCRMHTSSCVWKNGIFIFGGQEEDVPRLEGGSNHVCDFSFPLEEVFAETYFYDLETHTLRTSTPLPVKLSHNERAISFVRGSVILAGGLHNRRELADVVYRFDLEDESWELLGHLPYPAKACISVYNRGWLYSIGGQRSRSPEDRRPGKVIDSVWKAKLPNV